MVVNTDRIGLEGLVPAQGSGLGPCQSAFPASTSHPLYHDSQPTAGPSSLEEPGPVPTVRVLRSPLASVLPLRPVPCPPSRAAPGPLPDAAKASGGRSGCLALAVCSPRGLRKPAGGRGPAGRCGLHSRHSMSCLGILHFISEESGPSDRQFRG